MPFGGDDGGAVGVDERRALEEADGRERRVVGRAQHGAFHLSAAPPPARADLGRGLRKNWARNRAERRVEREFRWDWEYRAEQRDDA